MSIDLQNILRMIERQAKEMSIDLLIGAFEQEPDAFVLRADASDEIGTFSQIKNVLYQAQNRDGIVFLEFETLDQRAIDESVEELAELSEDDGASGGKAFSHEERAELKEVESVIRGLSGRMGEVAFLSLTVSSPDLPCYLTLRLFSEWYDYIYDLERITGRTSQKRLRERESYLRGTPI